MEKIESIAKRDLDRKLDIQKRKEEKGYDIADGEKIGVFEKNFNEKRNEIENLLEKSVNLNITELPEHLNDISKKILILQKYVAQSSIFLRCYDIKKCHEILQELTTKARELEDKLLPKKKFGFKNKFNKPKHCEKPSKDEVDFKNKQIILPHNQIECGFLNKNNENLTLDKFQLDKKDVVLENLTNCTVKLYGTPSTLHINKLRDCTVFTGPVSTSIFVDNCENCTFVIACQQLRLHSSHHLKIFLHVTSRAIMEDCKEILLAPYNWDYEGSNKDWLDAGLDRNTNNWDQVDDFNWLKLEKKSPNWHVIPESDLQIWK